MAYLLIQSDACRLPLADQSVDFVFGSPPYMDARLYLEGGVNLGIARKMESWIEWMLGVVSECVRVSRGPVVFIASGKTKDRNYFPACEGLMYRWHLGGGHAYRPCFWNRQGIAGSGGDQWFRADVEYAMCFKRPGEVPYSDNTAMGHAPKWAPGGAMSHRLTSGARVNQWGGRRTSGRSKRADGSKQEPGRPGHRYEAVAAGAGRMTAPAGERGKNGEVQAYIPPAISNPGNLVKTLTGGGHLGHPLAHENEAPFPVDLATWFIKPLCPPGGLVLDPFSGSGTTVDAARQCGRVGIGGDLRMSQCRLGGRRLGTPYQAGKKKSPKVSPINIQPLITDYFEAALS